MKSWLIILLAVAALTAAAAGTVLGSGTAGVEAKALFETKCSICHSTAKPLGRTDTKDGWAKIVTRMQGKKSGLINDEEAALIVDWLAENQGR